VLKVRIRNDMIFDFQEPKTRYWIRRNNSSKKYFIESFKKYYDYIRGFYCTKIQSFDDFSEGILPGNVAIIKEKACRLFCIHKNNTLTSEIIKNHIVKEVRKLHFFIVRASIKNAITYALFGSEELIRIADKINERQNDIDARKILIKSGKPVIFHLNVPTEYLSNKEIGLLFDVIMQNDLETIDSNALIAESLFIRKKLLPEHIVRIEKLSLQRLILHAKYIGMI
jgi:hypothetical protein